MPDPSLKELNQSIELLSSYHDRLQKEVISVSKKLQMPEAKIKSSLENNSELTELKITLQRLTSHRDKQIKEIEK
tara:strand:+ start:2063 stop:2287 length:225 start_codon:yes stop_codon:yes gene_type:complete